MSDAQRFLRSSTNVCHSDDEDCDSQARQAKVLTGGRELREAQFDAPCLLAISAFDRIAGLYNRHLKSNRGI